MTKKKLRIVLEHVSRPELIKPHKEYNILGVKWYAQGAWIKNSSKGIDIKARKLFKVHANDLIYNRLFAWKGSFTIIGKELDGCYVSNEYPAFRIKKELADINYIHMLLSQPRIWEKIERQSTGVSSISRNRFKVDDFLNLNTGVFS